MNSNNNEEIVEETPMLRSVKIGSLSTLPPLSKSFASPLKFQQPAHQKVLSAKQSTPVSSQAWNVDEQLPALQADYVLERTNVYVNNSTSQEVADRISKSLKTESISSRVSEEKKNSLEAESSQGLKFVVSLFADDASVVVEVQRLEGCSFEFRQACKAVCRSAKGQAAGPPKKSFGIPSCVPRETAEQQAKRFRSGLEAALSLIKSDRLDSQLMGFESMEKLSASPNTASSLLEGDCLDILMERCDEVESTSDIEEQHSRLMRRRVFTILANGLSACKNIPLELACESFVRKLLLCLSNSQEEPHEACQAARCLQALSSSDASMQALLNELNATSVLSSAEGCNHLALEQESRKLTMILSR
jgi:hypothetical protein